MNASLKERFDSLDPRAKLLFVITMGNACFMAPGNLVICWCFGLSLVILLIAQKYGNAAMSGIIFLIALGLDALSARYMQNDMWGVTFGMFSFMLLRLTPTFAIAGWTLNTTGAGRVITAMQNMRLPKGFTIAIAVMFRFVPTVLYEFRYIKNTMKLRGVGLSWKRVLCHPLQTMEYSLVPLLMRSLKISDDLSASALTRGLGRPQARSSLVDVRLGFPDYLAMLLFILLVLAGFFGYAGIKGAIFV